MTAIPQTMTAGRDALLRRALQADLAVSGSSTAAALLAAGPIAAATGIPAGLLQAIGAAFIAFVALLAYTATRPMIDRRLASGITALNFGWVALSAAALIFGWLPLSPAGFWLVVAQAIVVDLLAVAQFIGLRRLR
jgi:hypothetical protein